MLKLAVVGAGHMGCLHAEKVVALQQQGVPVALEGICDIDPDRAHNAAQRFGTRGCTQGQELFRDVDAAIIAVPTVEHFRMVLLALEAGCDVLVEKPIAADLEEAERLIKRASELGLILQVGHLEWFNAGFHAVASRIHDPRLVEVVRVGPFGGRATDTDVVRDLMIHDLDLVQQLTGCEPEKIEATGVAVLTEWIDIANARLVFPGGCAANLTASRVSRTSKRKIRIFQSDSSFEVDLRSQTASISRVVSREGAGFHTQVIDAPRRDALVEQLRSFLACIESRESPQVGGTDGMGALRTALRVLDAMAFVERHE